MASMGPFVSSGDAATDEGCSADEADSGVVINSSEVRFPGANKREMIEIVMISVTSARKTTLTPVRDTAAALLVEGSTRSRPRLVFWVRFLAVAGVAIRPAGPDSSAFPSTCL